MKPYWQSSDGRHVIHHGDCLEVLPILPAGSIDAVVTDPPYSSGGAFRGDRTQKTGTLHHRLLLAGLQYPVHRPAGNYRTCPHRRLEDDRFLVNNRGHQKGG